MAIHSSGIVVHKSTYMCTAQYSSTLFQFYPQNTLLRMSVIHAVAGFYVYSILFILYNIFLKLDKCALYVHIESGCFREVVHV